MLGDQVDHIDTAALLADAVDPADALVEFSGIPGQFEVPGNIRELKAIICDAVSVGDSRVLSLVTFRRRIGHLIQPGQDPVKREGISAQLFTELATLPTLEEVALQLMKEAMRRADGNQSIASHLLGISQPALSKRLKRLL